MKRIYSVNNSKDVLGTLEGLKSRITSTKPVLTMLALLMVCLFGVNENAWGIGKAKLQLYSSPSTGGYVYANTSNSNNIGTLTEDDATSGTATKAQTLYRFASAKSNLGYVFKGWGDESSNSGPTSSSVSVNVGSWGGTHTDTYYAIFARLTARSTEGMAFGTKLIGVGWNEGTTKSVTIDYVHAGNITATITGTNKTEFSLSSSSSSQSTTVVSNNTNSETNSTITVYFKPSSVGSKSAKLTISSNNGLTSIEINLSGTGQATVNPTFTNTIAASYYVEDGPLNLASLWTSDNAKGTITYSKVSFKADVENETGATVPSISNDNKLSLGQAGTLVIQMHQAASTGYYEKTVKDTIRINKRSNTLYANSSASFAPTMYTDKTLAVTLTASNTDYAGSPISCEQTAGEEIATYSYNQSTRSGDVSSNYRLGSATWTLSQPENYKYQAGSGSFTVNVIQQPAEECYLLNEPTEHSMGKYGDSSFPTAGNASYTYSWSGRGAVLSFKMWKYSNANDIGNAIYIYDASGKQLQSEDYSIGSMSTSETSYTITLNSDARSVKFQNGGGAWASASTLNTYIKDIKVSRATWLNIATDNGNNGTLTINKKSDGSAINPGQTGVANSKIYWSCVDGGDLKIVCENQHFSFSQNTITNTACNNGTTDITVSYTNTEPGTETATVTVYNQMYRQTFTVKGVIEKADQLITWHNDILRLGQSYTDVATANTLVTYESEDESIIRVDEDDEGHKTILTAVGTGTVNITATAEESSFYAEKSGTKGIKVTEKQIQWIDWNQSLFGLKLGGANVTMNAVAASDVEGCVSSRLIEYSSNNESVVKVVNNNQLQIIGVGTAIITAVQAGGFDTDGHDYERAETEKTVIVRDPNASCESFAYQQGQEVKMDCGWNTLDKQTRTSEINFNGIIPATGTLRYKGENRKVAINYFDGTMSVEQYIPGNSWQPVKGGDLGKPSIGTYQTANLTFDRRATKMRVKVTDGLGYHYFTDCQVTQARFIETTTPVDFNLNVGQQQNQVIYLSYSNITDRLSLTLAQGANSHFSVDKSFIEGSCGSAAKNVALTITYHPTAEETNAQDVLTITDGTTSCQVVLTGSATRVNRHINWDHADETDIYTVQTETLSAEARTDLNELAGVVTFSLASSSTATGAISMENVLSFTSAGVANVVAYTTDDARYNAAPNVTKVFNVSKTPTTISTLPVLAAVTSGTAVGDVELTGWQVTNTVNGGVVEGTLAITSADLINVGTNTVTLTFTPSNTDMYVGCTGTTTIVVNKATSVATPSAANIVYGQKVNESVLSNVGTDGTWAWKEADRETVLLAGKHTLYVDFTPDNSNYTTIDNVAVELTVEKANPVATANAVEITYGATASSVELSGTGVAGTWSWTDSRKDDVLAAGEYTMDVHFVPNDGGNYNEKDATVALTVNKATSVATPTAADITAGQKVSESVLTNSGTAGVWAWDEAVKNTTPAAGTHNYTVHFTPDNANYTTLTTTVSLKVIAPINEFTNADGDGDWNNPANWTSMPEGANPDVIVSGQLIIDNDVTVGGLTIKPEGGVTVITNGTLTVNGSSNDQSGYGDLYVRNGGEVEVAGNLRVGDLVVEASIGTSIGNAKSGQVANAENIVYTNAYIDINMDPSGVMDDTKWYGFTVPFAVNAHNGVSRKVGSTYQNCNYGTDYIIAEYDAAKRLSSGKGWKYLSGNTLNAGQFYYFGGDGGYNTYRFKASGNTYTPVAEKILSMNGTGADANWNAVGNSTLQHAKVSFEGGNYVQVYQNGLDAYKTVATSEATFVVGCPFFIQASENATLALSVPTDASEKYYAPRRSNATQEGVARVNLTSVDGGYSDQIYVSGTEKENDEYVLGHDLSKAGLGTAIPQLWLDAYGQKLSVHEAVWQGENALCQLGIYAPKEGEYILTATQPENGTQVYLTIDGMPVWNISEADYVLSLEKGTMNNYGLMLIQASRMPTDVENVEAADGEKTQKIILNDHLYILRDSRMYDVTGKKVK